MSISPLFLLSKIVGRKQGGIKMNQEKRLDLSMVEKATKKTYKRIEVQVGEITAIVKVSQRITPDEKIDILQESVKLNMEHGFPETVCLTLAMIQSLTNIDFPEELKGKLVLIEYLKDEGYLDRIMGMIPETEMLKLINFINDSAEGIKILSDEGHLDENSEFTKKMKEKIEKSVEEEK